MLLVEQLVRASDGAAPAIPSLLSILADVRGRKLFLVLWYCLSSLVDALVRPSP